LTGPAEKALMSLTAHLCPESHNIYQLTPVP